MDEELEEFFCVPETTEAELFDFDYEFDAPRFYDFSRPDAEFEVNEAELWFESAGSYPPSPFVIKLKLRNDISGEYESTSSRTMDDEMSNSNTNDSYLRTESDVSAVDNDDSGPEVAFHVDEDTVQSQTRSRVKSSLRGSTLMKPTASHLAKQNQLAQEVHSRLLRRFQKVFVKLDEKSSKNSSLIEGHATKRQKLEAGYLRKVAHLKHQALFMHKIPKKVGSPEANFVHARSKVTIPREPQLETARRAQRHRSKVKEKSNEGAKSDARTFKAHPLNKKILEAPSLLPPKRSMPQLPEFRVFHLRTQERARQHASNHAMRIPNYVSISRNQTTDSGRLNSGYALNEEKWEAVQKHKACHPNKKILSGRGEGGGFQNITSETMVPMKFNFPRDEALPNEPPTDLFSKLSLSSDVQPDIKCKQKMALTTKGSKENTPGFFPVRHEIMKLVKEKPRRISGLQHQCRSDGTTEIGPRLNISRTLDIR